MKTRMALLTLAAIASPTAAFAQECGGTRTPDTVKLSMEATNVRNADGLVAFTIYADDKKKFLAKGGKLLIVRVPAASPVTHACAWLPPGKYAIAQYHDENGDMHFNRTLMFPKEGYGFSNDAPTTFSLPAFEDVRFTLPPGGLTIRMKMRYP
jgi:uncharacterized protein (DUF2141 family)